MLGCGPPGAGAFGWPLPEAWAPLSRERYQGLGSKRSWGKFFVFRMHNKPNSNVRGAQQRVIIHEAFGKEENKSRRTCLKGRGLGYLWDKAAAWGGTWGKVIGEKVRCGHPSTAQVRRSFRLLPGSRRAAPARSPGGARGL